MSGGVKPSGGRPEERQLDREPSGQRHGYAGVGAAKSPQKTAASNTAPRPKARPANVPSPAHYPQ